MGVPQFLKYFLPTAGRPVDLRSYVDGILPPNNNSTSGRRPLRIGLDVSTWVYKATVGFGDMLADERHLSNYGRATLHFQQGEEETAKPAVETVKQQYIASCVKYVMDRILTLQKEANARVLVVLDGASPPIKNKEEGPKRSKKRMEAQNARDETVDTTGDAQAQEQRIKANRRAGAGQHYTEVLTSLIRSLRENSIPFLVSPYESDGQLAHLASNGIIDLIVTEDSDLAAYEHGAAPILYKLSDSISSGNPTGIMIRRGDLAANNPENLDVSDFSTCMLAVLFVCVGSDYCTSLKGIGIVAACKIVRSAFFENKGGRSPLEIVFEQLFQFCWKKEWSESEKAEFRSDFLSALLMFRHPVVYDPVKRICKIVGEPDPELVAYAPYKKLCRDTEKRSRITGPIIEPPMATFIAEGWVSPKSKRPYDCEALPDHVRRYFDQQNSAKSVEVEMQESDDDDEAEPKAYEQGVEVLASQVDSQSDGKRHHEDSVEVEPPSKRAAVDNEPDGHESEVEDYDAPGLETQAL